MKRTTIPVLLVVLTLFCATSLCHTDAWAGDPEGALRVPPTTKHDGAQVLETTGTADDDQGGDPDTAGDTLGFKKVNDLLGASDGFEGDQDVVWLELMLKLMDCFTILR